METNPNPPPSDDKVSVFISYSHEKNCQTHKKRVTELSDALTSVGFTVSLDQQHPKEPVEGWAKWSAQLQSTDHTLVVLSENYGKTQGTAFEDQMMTVLKQLGAPTHQFTQVFFDERFRDQDFLLKHIKPYLGGNIYDLCLKPVTENGRWQSLLRRIQASRKAVDEEAERMKDNAKQIEEEIQGKRSNGIILVGDIVDFSGDRFGPKEQRELMSNLWKWLYRNRSWKGWELHLDSTLDGAIVVFDINDGTSTNSIEEDALEFAQAWIAYMSAGAEVPGLTKKQVGFRVGIDAGHYEMFDLPKGNENENGRRHLGQKIVGRGPNDCDRLTRLGGISDVVASENFVRALSSEVLRLQDWTNKFSPSIGKEPLQAFPKAYRAQDFRLFTGHKPGQKVEMPEVLRELQAATAQTMSVLNQIADHYWELLFETAADKLERHSRLASKGKGKEPSIAEWKQALDEKKAQLRVSFFLPDPFEPEDRLACTLFRVADPGLKEELRKKIPLESKTVYSVKGKGQGPAGHAFVSGLPFVCHRLPDPEKNLQEYLKKMKPLGMAEADCVNGSRHARSFMCFPCSLGDLPPIAVVCIDSMISLEWFTRAELLNVAKNLQSRFGLVLTLLAKARR